MVLLIVIELIFVSDDRDLIEFLVKEEVLKVVVMNCLNIVWEVDVVLCFSGE